MNLAWTSVGSTANPSVPKRTCKPHVDAFELEWSAGIFVRSSMPQRPSRRRRAPPPIEGWGQQVIHQHTDQPAEEQRPGECSDRKRRGRRRNWHARILRHRRSPARASPAGRPPNDRGVLRMAGDIRGCRFASLSLLFPSLHRTASTCLVGGPLLLSMPICTRSARAAGRTGVDTGTASCPGDSPPLEIRRDG